MLEMVLFYKRARSAATAAGAKKRLPPAPSIFSLDQKNDTSYAQLISTTRKTNQRSTDDKPKSDGRCGLCFAHPTPITGHQPAILFLAFRLTPNRRNSNHLFLYICL